MQNVKFTFGRELTSQQYVTISVAFPTTRENTILRLAVWRPGRYELGNFAKNVRNLLIRDENGSVLAYEKENDSTWLIDTSRTNTIAVSYEYFANELNSGSTFIDQTQLYVNPVNCCMFTDETFDRPVAVELNVPPQWQIACSMKLENGEMHAHNFDELFDSPFVASSRLQYRTFEAEGVKFFVWFNGEVKPNWAKVLGDFKKFTEKQIQSFGGFPVKEYHYINQIVPFRKYHGVEHVASTIITLGPTFEIFEELYSDLLGVSSHELYHAWNVKSIRPIEMHPYDFTIENYSPLGYLCEGVTTYQGDLFLLKSGVFNEGEFFFEFSDQFQKHFDNPGRLNYSVRSSSIDTWLDGYDPGAPGRKVSIYTEGCLLAFITDVFIMKSTNNAFNIDNVMRYLYEEYALKNKGVSEKDYLNAIEHISGASFQTIYNAYFVEPGDLTTELDIALNYVGCELTKKASPSISEAKYGIKFTEPINAGAIKAIYPGSPADKSGLMLEDEIFAVNRIALTKSLDKWISHFQGELITLLVRRNGLFLDIQLKEPSENYYMRYKVSQIENPSDAQRTAYLKWIS
jgi:predicted metalloprotease with PDZ domain